METPPTLECAHAWNHNLYKSQKSLEQNLTNLIAQQVKSLPGFHMRTRLITTEQSSLSKYTVCGTSDSELVHSHQIKMATDSFARTSK